MIDYTSWQEDRIGIGLGGFSTSMMSSLSEFYVYFEVEFTDINGNLISVPPLTNNPVSASFKINVPSSGYVFGVSTSILADFLSSSQYADIHDLHYTIEFYSDSNLQNSLDVFFNSGQAQFRPMLSGGDPISIGQVPIPATLLLFGSGLLGLGGCIRKFGKS